MDKILNLFPKTLLAAYVVKMIALSPSLTDVGIVVAVSVVVAIQLSLEKKNTIEDVRIDCNKKLEEIKQVVNKQIEVISQMSVEVAKVKTDMQGVKLKSGFLEAGTNLLTGRKVG